MNGTHQLLSHADDVNIFGESISIWNNETGTLLDPIKEGDVEVNAEESGHQNARQIII
jgi:hypothetical protein